MPTLPFTHQVLAGVPVGTLDGRPSRMSRPAVIASVVAHLVVLYAASQWYEAEPAQVSATFEWVSLVEPPSEPAVQPMAELVEPPAPIAEPTPRPRNAVPRAVAPPLVVPLKLDAPAETLPEAPVAPSRLDLDAARRAAAIATVEQHARDGNVRAPSVDDVPPPLAPAPKQPSIFDPQRHSGGGFLSPSKAHTVVGQRLSLWCNKVSGGGFGFFGIPICTSGTIEPPSGILADSIPEYMKLKPECEETEPLAATLGEASPYPTMKCRLVPKDPY